MLIELVIKEFGIKRDLISLNELIEVQKKYGISIQAIVYRLVDAGIFTENRKTDFYKKINNIQRLRKCKNRLFTFFNF